MEEHDKHHLPRQFNLEFYDSIESFQEEWATNKPLHVRNIHAERDCVYIPPLEEHTLNSPIVRISMLQDLLGDNYALEEIKVFPTSFVTSF
jgi:hypothetical protein